MIRRLAAALLVLLLAAGGARAQEFSLPGLSSDADSYAGQLTARNPAGGTPQARAKAEQAASAAVAKGDWTAAAAALETRIALGEAKPEQWLALARADLRRTPPDLAHALAAAWQAYAGVETGPAQVPALLAMADALKAQNRPAQQLQALEAVVQRTPERCRRPAGARRGAQGRRHAGRARAHGGRGRSGRAPASRSPARRRGGRISMPGTGCASSRRCPMRR